MTHQPSHPPQDSWRWTQLSAAVPDSARPPRRDMASLTHSGSGGLLLLGGRAENGRTLGDAWVFDTQK